MASKVSALLSRGEVAQTDEERHAVQSPHFGIKWAVPAGQEEMANFAPQRGRTGCRPKVAKVARQWHLPIKAMDDLSVGFVQIAPGRLE